MKNLNLLFASVFLILILSGCNNIINKGSLDSTSEISPESLAGEYVDILRKQSNIANSRAVSSAEYPDILYDLEIEDDDGNPILFADMSDSEKQMFYEFWKSEYISELSEKLAQDEGFMEMLIIENKAFNEALRSSTQRSAFVNDFDRFAETYTKTLQKYANSAPLFRSGSSNSKTVNIDDSKLIEESLKVYKENYRKGRILVDSSSSRSSGSFYLGHASMMCKDKFEDEWKTSNASRTTITSFPLNLTTTWSGQTDGVQYEPIGYWCGDKAAKKVSILDVRSKTWRWFRPPDYAAASSEEYARAVENAKDYLGKPYNMNLVFGGMWSTEKFYCSSLVFRAWYQVDKKYKLNTNLLWVKPSNLISSERTTTAATFVNR